MAATLGRYALVLLLLVPVHAVNGFSYSQAPYPLGVFDSGTVTPIISGSWYRYSDGAEVRVVRTTNSRAVIKTVGTKGVVTLGLHTTYFTDPAGYLMAVDGKIGRLVVQRHGGTSEAGLLLSRLIGGAAPIAETSTAGFDGRIGFLDFESPASGPLERITLPDGTSISNVILGSAHRNQLPRELRSASISEVHAAVKPGVGWVYARVVYEDGTQKELWATEWHVPATDVRRSVDPDTLLAERADHPDPANLVRIPGWNQGENLGDAAPARQVGPFTSDTTVEQLVAFSGRTADTRWYWEQENLELYAWYHAPYFPRAIFAFDPETAALKRATLDHHSVIGTNRLWPHFGNGLSFGARLEKFVQSGLLRLHQETESSHDYLGRPVRTFTAGSYELAFTAGAFTDQWGVPLPGFRLTKLVIPLAASSQ